MTFIEYYKAQLREVPAVWRLAKGSRKKGWLRAFIGTVLTLLLPMVVYMMWLYDTGQMETDERFREARKGDGEE